MGKRKQATKKPSTKNPSTKTQVVKKAATKKHVAKKTSVSDKKAAEKKTKPAKKKASSPGQLSDQVLSERKQQGRRVTRQLAKDYSHAVCALNYETPVQLLIATILSAQCTDERVNIVTKDLFAKYPTSQDLAKAPVDKIEKLVQSAGFYRNKAKNIKACCQELVKSHQGEVPKDLDALVKLAGVGRKTANVVLGTAFGIPTGVVVDTHVGRISKRLGLTEKKDPVQIERELMAILPKKQWIDYSHRMIYHGRAVCKARKPRCESCTFEKFCPQVGVE